MMKKTLGTIIAELRKQHGMTQLELAEKMGVPIKPYPNGNATCLARILTPF